MKLLLVDDNDRLRRMMKSLYSSHFDEVIECGDGTEAVAAYNENNPDWVVMDIKMKRMDGIEATEKIIASNPKARVIIISQYNDESTIDAVKNAGAFEFVSKKDFYKVIEVKNKNNKE